MGAYEHVSTEDVILACQKLIEDSMEENEYISPHLTELEFYPEGVLCGSNEVIDENEGIW